MTGSDLKRELEKLRDVLRVTHAHHELRDESNAQLHMSDRVIKSPLTVALDRAQHDLDQLMWRLEEEDVTS